MASKSKKADITSFNAAHGRCLLEMQRAKDKRDKLRKEYYAACDDVHSWEEEAHRLLVAECEGQFQPDEATPLEASV